MNVFFGRFAAAITLTLAVGATAIANQTAPVVGQPAPRMDVRDQHDQAWEIGSDTALILYSSSRSASSLVQAVLVNQPPGFLASRRAAYLANLSRMPAFITRTLALPALREMPFRMGVVMDNAITANWPVQDGAVTLIEIKGQVVQTIRHVRSEADLRVALGLTLRP